MDINLTTHLETLYLVQNPALKKHGSHKPEIHKNVISAGRILKAKYLLKRLCKEKKKN